MKQTICQVIDSSGNVPLDIIEKYTIDEVSFYFKFNNTDYMKENIDYTTNEFFEYMEENPDDIPKTSAPNIYDWLSLFKERYAQGVRKYIVTTVASKLSGSFQAANSAKEMFKESYDDVYMEVVNSNTCACGQAALEIWIAKMIDMGKDFESIVKRTHEMIPYVNTLFTVNSLKYMQAGGRIGAAAAFLGKVINIKPVCEFIDGEVHVIKPIIGRKKSIRAMVDVVISRITNINRSIIVLQHAKAQKDADYMYQYLKEKTKDNIQIFTSNLGVTVGAHSGPGSIGIGFIEY